MPAYSLDEFATEAAPTARLIDVKTAGLACSDPPAALSRIESLQGRRFRRSRLRQLLRRASTLVFDHPESDRIVIASLLSVVAIGYGFFLMVAWRAPVEVRVLSAPSRAELFSVPAVVAPAVETEPVVTPRASRGLTTAALTAMWKRRDTRSLEQAFAGLRQETLAFHRCAMRMTGNDRAVARCESAGTAWTIDFERSAERWQIAGVTRR